jgi:peptide methionine sulfoxide reductase msrA/msrB
MHADRPSPSQRPPNSFAPGRTGRGRRLLMLFLAAAVVPVGLALQPQPKTTPSTEPSPMQVKRTQPKDGPQYSASAYDITPLAKARIEELAKRLTPDEAKVILRKGTEAPFCGTLLDNKKEGAYICRLCGLPLFSSESKFDSGTGWPSFYKPFDPAHIRYEGDSSHGMVRDEILCARCGGHLGHVFDDAPQTPTGLRYCLNSASLEFVEKGTPFPAHAQPVRTETAYFAGGCFWGVEDNFQQIPGVVDAVSGYMGGRTANPTYKEVCSDTTGHAETVKVVYNPEQVSYRQLLEWFFKLHDPTQVNRQGPDIGESYRSAIFAATPEQFAAAKAFIEEQSRADRFRKGGRTIATQLVQAEKTPFWPAEDYHQDYHAKHGGSCALPEH